MEVGSVQGGIEGTLLTKKMMQQGGPNILIQSLQKSYEEALKNQTAQITGKGINVDRLV